MRKRRSPHTGGSQAESILTIQVTISNDKNEENIFTKETPLTPTWAKTNRSPPIRGAGVYWMLWAYIQAVAFWSWPRIVEVDRATLHGTTHRPVKEPGHAQQTRKTDGIVTGQAMERQRREQLKLRCDQQSYICLQTKSKRQTWSS